MLGVMLAQKAFANDDRYPARRLSGPRDGLKRRLPESVGRESSIFEVVETVSE